MKASPANRPAPSPVRRRSPLAAISLMAACLLLLLLAVPLRAAGRKPQAALPDSFAISLKEVVVKPKKEKYSKKNNPAVDFMERIRRLSHTIDPRRNPYYGFDKYERITLAINDFQALDSKGDTTRMLRALPMLRANLDTSAVTGKPILNIALREKSSHVAWRREPKAEKELVTGLRNDGLDDMIDPEAMRIFYEDVLREVDVYSNDITLLQNRFVSPLGRMAADFYKFYLADTLVVAGDSCAVLAFVPRNNASFGFTGKMYVGLADTASMFVRRVEMNVPKAINLNFVEALTITQEFEQAPDGSTLKTLDDMVVEARLIPGTPGLYGRRVTALRNHSFEPPPDLSVFDLQGAETVTRGAAARADDFWQQRRFVEISGSENAVGNMMSKLRSVKAFYWAEKLLKIMVTGYIQTGKRSVWDIGPMNTTISGNTLEGVRLRAGGMSTANLSRRWFTRDYVAWGTRDHRWKYGVELEYSFIDKDYHSREFPVHAIRATHRYDVDMLGQHYLFTNPDNMFLSFKRCRDIMMTYKRETTVKYIREWLNNFSFELGVSHQRQEASPYINFWDGNGRFFNHFQSTALQLTLRFAPGEKFFQTKSNRLPVNLDAPVFQVTQSWGPKGMFGSRWAVAVTEALVQKRWWLSAFGYVDMILRGGHVWTSSPFTQLLIPNANLSYTIQPESYTLMNAMEFINDSYASWDLTYWLNGALLNLVPGVKKLKLREALSFRGLWGHLSDKNNPALQPGLPRFPLQAATRPMTDTPYMEAGVGLDNIFKILRLDYVWRLTYRDTPHAPKSGLRLALHFTF